MSLGHTTFGAKFTYSGEGINLGQFVIERSRSCRVVLTNSDNVEPAFRQLLEKILGDTITPWEWEGYTRKYIEESRKN